MIPLRLRPLVLALAALALSTACGRYLSTAAAVVNGVSLSQSELDSRVQSVLENPQFSGQFDQAGDRGKLDLARQLISDMIQQELVRQETERLDLSATAQEITEQIDRIRGQFPTPEAFDEAVAREGLDAASLRARIAERIRSLKLRESLAEPVTEAQVRATYTRDRSKYEEVRARHILFQPKGDKGDAAALALARKTFGEIRAGADFKTLAKKRSDDPGSKEKGGDLGYARRGTFVPEFDKAAFTQKVGIVSQPIRTSFGYHLIQVIDRRVTPYSAAKAEIRSALEEERGEAGFEAWYARTVAAATIIVNPRYGDWDSKTRRISDHIFFVPPTPATDPIP